MPYQPAVTPVYGLQTQAWQMMNQAAGNLGRGIAEGVEKRKQEHKDYKAMVALAPSYGIPKEQAEMMGAAKLSGMLRGKVYEEEKARREEESAYRKATLDKLRAESVRNVEERRAEEKIGRGLNDYFYQGPAGIAANRPVNRDTLAQWAVQQPGALQSENVRRLMQYFPEAPKAGGWNLSPGQTVDYGDGRKALATTANSVQIVSDPREQEPGVTFSRDPLTGELRESYTGPLSAVERLRAAAMGTAVGPLGPGPGPGPVTAPPGNGVIRAPSGVTATPISGGTVNLNGGGGGGGGGGEPAAPSRPVETVPTTGIASIDERARRAVAKAAAARDSAEARTLMNRVTELQGQIARLVQRPTGQISKSRTLGGRPGGNEVADARSIAALQAQLEPLLRRIEALYE